MIAVLVFLVIIAVAVIVGIVYVKTHPRFIKLPVVYNDSLHQLLTVHRLGKRRNHCTKRLKSNRSLPKSEDDRFQREITDESKQINLFADKEKMHIGL